MSVVGAAWAVPLTGSGAADRVLAREEVARLVAEGLDRWSLEGRRVLCLIPDLTRTAPVPLLFRLVHDHLAGRVAALDWLIALGTHPPLGAAQIDALVGAAPGEWETTLARTRVFNHEWDDPEKLVSLGEIAAEEVEELSGGLLSVPVAVRINRRLLDYDVVIVVGPVFPHEVIGFSGGNKYFFPGVSGREVIDVSHWLGALITSYEIIGTLGPTPVRRLVDRAASLLPVERRCVAMIVRPADSGLHGLYLGSCEEAWAAAAALSAQVHVRYLDAPVRTVLSVVPTMYADMWTAAKGMYKLEPVVADGGELVLHAPHVRELSAVHGETIGRIGYHCRDYFLRQWEGFRDVPLGVLAHSTHLRGVGTYDPASGVERCRIRVTLATGIGREECERLNLGWRDPASIDPAEWEGREGVLVVPRAGETLHRLRGSR